MSLAKGLVDASAQSSDIIRTAFAPHDQPDLGYKLRTDMGAGPFELLILFVSPQAQAKSVLREVKTAFPGTRMIGCTTAGEITDQGYAEGMVVAVGLPESHFRARTMLIEDLDSFDGTALIDRMIRTRDDMQRGAPDWRGEFNFLMIDGLSIKEDQLATDLANGLGTVQLFGGSAGDGENFKETFIFLDGQIHRNAAVLTQVRTVCPVKVFKTDHLTPTESRMVVTGANPATRTVSEINAEPAAREYARILGKDPEQLTTFTFAAHPLVVRIGGQHHVRAIQRVAENGDLVFFSAIDEGLVLSLARSQNMVTHLEREIDGLSHHQTPDMILACDCILRRIEAQQKQLIGPISRILSENRVVGFSTYGEQLNSMHVNQTLTGVAIYPPEKG